MRNYITQEKIIEKISESTVYSEEELAEVFDAIEDILLDLILSYNKIEIRLLKGMKINSEFLEAGLVKTNLTPDGYTKANDRMKLSCSFTDNYKKKVNRCLLENKKQQK